MGTNYYLEKVDGSDWTLPVQQLGYVASSVILLVKNKGESTLSLDVDRCTETLKRLHIGKSSYGWHFSLCIYPYLDIYNLDDWKLKFKSDKYRIVDEYNEELTQEEMLDIITNVSPTKGYTDFIEAHKEEFIGSSHNRNLGLLPSEKYSLIRAYERETIEELNKLAAETADHIFGKLKTYNSYDELLKENNAERGLNGLWAHKSSITDDRDDPAWKGFVPIVSTYIRTDGTYDLTPDWNFV